MSFLNVEIMLILNHCKSSIICVLCIGNTLVIYLKCRVFVYLCIVLIELMHSFQAVNNTLANTKTSVQNIKITCL